MDRRVHGDYRCPPIGESGIGSLASVRRAIVHNPEYPSRRLVRFMAHDLFYQSFERFDACFPLTSTENLRSMNIPSRKIGQSALPLIFMFYSHHGTGLGRQRLCLSFSRLDTAFLISRDDIIRGSEGHPHPLFLVQIQYRPCLAGKLRIAWKEPTAILPRFDGIFIEPPPDGDPTDASDNALLNNEPLKVFPTEPRDRNAQTRGKFARQRFNRHYDSGGKTGRAARIWYNRPTHPGVAQKTSCAICSRFAEAYRPWQQFDHWRAPLQPRVRSWRAPQKNTVPYISVPCSQALPFHSHLAPLNKDSFLAYVPSPKRTIPG